MKLKKLILDTSEVLKAHSESARLDSELLIAYLLSFSRLKLITEGEQEISEALQSKLNELVERRVNGEPTAYITGTKEFFGREFMVAPAVLVPRPETELLVELALKHAKELSADQIKILDLGTGSGCIPITINLELEKLGIENRVAAADISAKALVIAVENAKTLGAEVQFIQSNWFENIEGQFDLIVSNPPYIAEGDTRVSRETKIEPHSALYSGADGLDDIKLIVEQAVDYLTLSGKMLIEIGFEQADAVRGLCSGEVTVHKDLAGLDRVVEI